MPQLTPTLNTRAVSRWLTLPVLFLLSVAMLACGETPQKPPSEIRVPDQVSHTVKKLLCDDDAHCRRIKSGTICELDGDGDKVCVVGTRHDCDAQNPCPNGQDDCVADAQGINRCVARPLLKNDGEACTNNDQCAGGTCLQGEKWPEGYCTTLGCKTRNDCAAESAAEIACLVAPDDSKCVRICKNTYDCREGYSCERVGNGSTRVCTKGEGHLGSGNSADLFSPTDYCKPARTGTITEFEFDIPPGTESYQLTSWLNGQEKLKTRLQRELTPIELSFPDGRKINFESLLYSYASGGPYSPLFAMMIGMLDNRSHPNILIPVAPKWADYVQEGVHHYSVKPSGPGVNAEICIRVLPESTPGDTLDLNFYLVGVPTMNAAKAKTNPEIMTMIDTVRGIYGQQNIKLGKINFYDVSNEAKYKYQVIGTQKAYEDLMLETVHHAKTKAEALAVNIFLVREIQIGGGGVLGISSGLPGLAGFHNEYGTGVVFTTDYLFGSVNDTISGQKVPGAEYTGTVMAHEIGHFIGLAHTSEMSGTLYDALADTPECPRAYITSNSGLFLKCPDIGNMMFPAASSINSTFSADQGFVFRKSPLTK